MEQRDVVTRLDRFDVAAHVDVETLDGLAGRRGRRSPRIAGLAVVAAGLVSVLWVAGGHPPAPIIEDPVAGQARPGSSDGQPTDASADVRAPDPDRPWQPWEVARLTFEGSSGDDLPVAISVREPDDEGNRMAELWLSLVDGAPFGPGTTVVQGHRTLYGAALYHLDVVETGDEIVVDLPDGGEVRYRVIETDTVPAGQLPPTIAAGETKTPRLLIATHAPRFTARDLLVVTAERT